MEKGKNKVDLDDKFIYDINKFQMKCYNDLLDKKSRLKNEIEKITTKKEEIQLIIDKEDFTDDKNFNYFSPINHETMERYEEYTKMLKNISIKIEKFKEMYKEITNTICKFEEIQQYVQLLENKIELLSKSHHELGNNKYDNSALFLLNAQENERKRIARDLHDSTVQNLTNLIHKTELCTKLIDSDPIRTKLELHTMTGTIRTTINDMRSIIYDLRPMSLDDLGLVVTVERFIQKIMCDTEMDVSFHVNNEEIKVYPVINLTLYRVIQEACNNSIKHSNASKITIELSYLPNLIELVIEDDGIGFHYDTDISEKENEKKDKSFGLSIMRERVYLLSGEIDIDTQENQGTKIKIVIPIEECMGEK